ncbi:MAG: substrate-binding domain-containing protein [Anaerolineae bacterium]|nr:substrate-binding domain-containing protein [Anaerolineae bacterium]
MFRKILRRWRTRPEIRIGIITSRSGPFRHWGQMSIQGLELGLEYATSGNWVIFDRPLRLLIEDDAGDPETGERKARTLVKQWRADILVGCVSSAVALRVSRVAKEYERIYFAEPAATDVLTGEWFHRYIFRTAPNVSQDAATAGRYAVEHLGRTFCFLSPDYILGHQSRSAWRRVIEGHGGETVGDILAPPDTTDFTPYLKEALASRADVFMPTWAGENLKILFAQMRDIGIFERMRVLSNLVDRESLRVLGKNAEGMVGPARYYYEFPNRSINAWFVRRHQDRYGEPPDLFAGTAFAAAIALVEGLKRTEAETGPAHLIPALEGMRFEGPKGTYTIREEDHQALQPMYIVEMVCLPDQPYCVPRLIQEVSAEESAPPVIKPR